MAWEVQAKVVDREWPVHWVERYRDRQILDYRWEYWNNTNASTLEDNGTMFEIPYVAHGYTLVFYPRTLTGKAGIDISGYEEDELSIREAEVYKGSVFVSTAPYIQSSIIESVAKQTLSTAFDIVESAVEVVNASETAVGSLKSTWIVGVPSTYVVDFTLASPKTPAEVAAQVSSLQSNPHVLANPMAAILGWPVTVPNFQASKEVSPPTWTQAHGYQYDDVVNASGVVYGLLVTQRNITSGVLHVANAGGLRYEARIRETCVDPALNSDWHYLEESVLMAIPEVRKAKPLPGEFLGFRKH
jgi:hypothetical protein